MAKLKTTERAFTSQMIDLAHIYHWIVAHFRPAQNAAGKWSTAVQGDGVGFPDLVLVRRERLIFAELKVGYRKPTPSQVMWARSLAATGVEVYLWRPEDIYTIQEVLS